MKTITGTIGAFLTPHCLFTLSEVMSKNQNEVVGAISYSHHEMSSHGWIKLGEATITIQIDDSAEIQKQAVLLLENQMKEIKAEAHAKCVHIERKIQSLLAIENDAG